MASLKHLAFIGDPIEYPDGHRADPVEMPPLRSLCFRPHGDICDTNLCALFQLVKAPLLEHLTLDLSEVDSH
ncbi:hypothetical protein HYDPIDRAFT_112218 [Hydnomerulius pinastri MD-312]|uniref:Uncharacterized protein n=1 Tax=Hydnomerulius pinastri MD-312 TaxID=994086 RepID=A0A0C9W0H3_9AGAM|nr:hypothetical protein HYDPIDRAFT_112218 [Hydnomerulius pinastri MD-312]